MDSIQFLKTHKAPTKAFQKAVDEVIAMAEKRAEALKFAKEAQGYLDWHSGDAKIGVNWSVGRFKTACREFVKLMGVE